MNGSYISARLRQQVAGRAHFRCEYCQTQELIIGMPLEVEHIVPRVLGGETEEGNLCLACPRCNRHKGVQTEAIDDVTSETVLLYHPRKQNWHDHFVWQDDGLIIGGSTPVGRATINALQMNNLFIRRSRELWVENGWHPPQD